MSKLLPCPFCGGRAERIEITEDDGFGNRGGAAIECQQCQASSHVEFGRMENLVSVWNTRPTPARCDELETVAHQYEWPSKKGEWRTHAPLFVDDYGVRELVTRQNAEAVIEKLKNEVAMKDKFIQSLIDFDSEEVKRLEADNAAKDARVKFLEKCVADQETQIVKQEASDNRDLQLIAALQPFSDIADLIDAETEGMSEADELTLQYYDYEFARWTVSLFRQARAALEDRP